jgi:hypothetical protein
VRTNGVSDETLERSLSSYVALVDKVLEDPARWLGADDDPDEAPAGLPQRALEAVRSTVLGDVTPAAPSWPQQPRAARVDWWVDRIGLAAGLAAAAPRLAGALSDRLPVQAALGASAAGLAVCAVAREHGVDEPAEWIPLLGEVLFGRQLSSTATVVRPEEAEQSLLHDEPDDQEEQSGGRGLTGGARRAARTLWRLASTFRDLQHLLDERPRGRFLARALANVPIVGLAGGWWDERGGIKKAAKETEALLARAG